MSKEIKKAIELLEKVDKHIIHHTCGYTITQDLKTLKDYVQQALTLLREAPEQPPAGEFTKECRRILRRCDMPRRQMADAQGSSIWSNVIWKKLDKACDIIDRAEARLKAMYAGDLSPESRLNGYKVVTDQLRQRQKELLEEKMKVEASKADLRTACETIFAIKLWANNIKNAPKELYEDLKQVEDIVAKAKKEG